MSDAREWSLDPNRIYSAAEVAELFARRRVSDAAQERTHVIEEGFRSLSSQVSGIDSQQKELVTKLDHQNVEIAAIRTDQADLKDTVTVAMGIGNLNPEEQAAVALVAKKYVLDGHVQSLIATKGGRIVAALAVLGPVLGVVAAKLFGH